ncbi:hypothetical protein PO909_015389 [Leuciscus waleckii]
MALCDAMPRHSRTPLSPDPCQSRPPWNAHPSLASSVRTRNLTTPPHRDTTPPMSGPVVPPCCPIVGTSVIHMTLLVQFLGAWLQLPNLFHWLARTIRLGYAIQFTRSPPRFWGVRYAMVNSASVRNHSSSPSWPALAQGIRRARNPGCWPRVSPDQAPEVTVETRLALARTSTARPWPDSGNVAIVPKKSGGLTDVDSQTHFRMCSSVGLVCSDRPEGQLTLESRFANTGTWCSGISPVWAFGSTGKRANSPRAEDLFSRYGNRLGRHVRAAYERVRAVTAELPESIQGQVISEASVAYGICSGSHAARTASYETAFALASRSIPGMGMATGHAPSTSYSVRPSPHGRTSPFFQMPLPRAGVPCAMDMLPRAPGQDPSAFDMSIASSCWHAADGKRVGCGFKHCGYGRVRIYKIGPVQDSGSADLGDAQVDLFASPDTFHCRWFYSLTEGTLGADALARSWLRGLRKYAFPPVSLLAQVLCKIREDERRVLLVAPHWPTRTWFSELTNSHVILRLRPGYVPKVPTTPFRDQVVNLQALPSEEADSALALLCPVRALRAYVDRAYKACGQAASSLHAMALLQVYQAKALMDMHEGSLDRALMSELRTATDLALRSTSVAACMFGLMMSTLVVQEHHRWLSLVDMADVDKVRFLDSPISQVGLFGDAVESCAQQFSATLEQTEAIRHILPRWPATAITLPPVAVPPPAPLQQPSPRPQRRASCRQAAQPVSDDAKPGDKCKTKRP